MDMLWQMSNGHIFHVKTQPHDNWLLVEDMDNPKKPYVYREANIALCKAYIRNVLKLEVISEEYLPWKGYGKS